MYKKTINNFSDDELLQEVARRIEDGGRSYYQIEQMFHKIEQLNKKLIYAERYKSHFLSMLRNAFNNPLMGIVSIIDELRDSPVNEANQKALTLLENEMFKLNFQISNLLSAAEIEMGMFEKNIVEFSFEKLITQIDKELGFLKQGHCKKINLEMDKDIRLEQDRDKIVTILRNIIANAFVFDEGVKPIVVKALLKSEQLEVTVINQGEYIINDEMLYGAFSQADDNYDRVSQGLGVGMSISKAFIDFLGGTIDYTSKNSKTLFRVSFKIKEFDEDDPFANFDLNFLDDAKSF